MPLRFRVCPANALAEDELQCFEVDGLDYPVMLLKIGGKILAATSLCPHEDVSLMGGPREGPLVVCPGHAYEFDMESGECSHDPDLCLKRYQVTIIDGSVHIDIL